MNKGSFIVLTDDIYSPTVAPTAVGFVEDVSDLGTLFTTRFSGDRVLNLREGQLRPATAAEVAANNADPDHEDLASVDDVDLYNIGNTLRRLGAKMTPHEYISAAKIRAHGSLSCDENDIRGMLSRIDNDQRDMVRSERKEPDHFQKIAAEEEAGDRMEGDKFE